MANLATPGPQQGPGNREQGSGVRGQGSVETLASRTLTSLEAEEFFTTGTPVYVPEHARPLTDAEALEAIATGIPPYPLPAYAPEPSPAQPSAQWSESDLKAFHELERGRCSVCGATLVFSGDSTVSDCAHIIRFGVVRRTGEIVPPPAYVEGLPSLAADEIEAVDRMTGATRCCVGEDVPESGWRHSSDCPNRKTAARVMDDMLRGAPEQFDDAFARIRERDITVARLMRAGRALAMSALREWRVRSLDGGLQIILTCKECGHGSVQPAPATHKDACRVGRVLGLLARLGELGAGLAAADCAVTAEDGGAR